MNKAALKLLLAALLGLPGALKAGFVSIPTVLTVHGLNPAAIACDPGSVQNAVHNEACYAAASLFSKMGDGEFDDSYLDQALDRLNAGRAQVYAFRWGGDIRTSRASVEKLKARILELHREARLKGAPFIIVAHSWGTVLTAEALAEMSGDGTAGDLRVDKLITLGSPLGATAYSLAINGLISGQNFYKTPRRAASIVKWENYHAGRDLISSSVKLADVNVEIDADARYSGAERELKDLAALAGVPGFEESAAAALEDLRHFSLADGTMIWHAAYFSRHRLELKSLRRALTIDAVDSVSPSCFAY